MKLYSISKGEKKRRLKELSSFSNSKGKDNHKNGFNKKHTYYITFEEIASAVKYGDAKNDKGLYHINASFIRMKKGKTPDVEKHSNIPVKYIACVVSPCMTFTKLEKRGIKQKERDDGKIVYFIPLQFVCSLLPKKYSFTENISTELFEMEMFKYTGKISMLLSLSIFNISNEIYLTDAASVDDQKICVII